MNSSSYEHFTLRELADGVYAAIAIPGKAAMSNAGIIDLGEQTLVFDTFMCPYAAIELLKASRQLTGRIPELVVNSHGHSDHWGGNQIFASDGTILSTAKTRERMQEAIDEWMTAVIAEPQLLIDDISELEKRIAATDEGPLRQNLEHTLGSRKYFLGALPGFRPTLPNETFAGTREFIGSKRTAVVHTVENCHTRSDAYFVLPADRIGFMGDLGFFQSHPFLLDSDPENWCATLEMLARMAVDTCVPGHGPAGGTEDLLTLRQYITTLSSEVRRMVQLGKSEDEIAAMPVPPPFDVWVDGFSRYEKNLRFLYHLNLN
jgi:glyoxylase-like metal-dependent hydrolase (beta-lactamase superfamily II)